MCKNKKMPKIMVTYVDESESRWLEFLVTFCFLFFYLDICTYHFLQRFLRHLVTLLKVNRKENKENVGIIFPRILER